MAPEVMRNDYSFKVDVYSYGMVLWEMLTYRIPWQVSEYSFSHQILKAVVRGERPATSEEEMRSAPEDFVALIRECWSTYEEDRPEFKEVERRLHRMREESSGGKVVVEGDGGDGEKKEEKSV